MDPQRKAGSIRRIVIDIVTSRATPHYGNLAIHLEEGGLESKVWYPELSRKFELIEPLVERAISDLRVVQQEI